MHLVVIQHGLWGKPAHMGYVDSKLRARFPASELETINYGGNSNTLTYDGVDVCGARLADAVVARLEDPALPKVDKVSFIGYSLGGLVTRYAIGILEARGLFAECTPANYISVATPHAGAARPPLSLAERVYNGGMSLVISTTGKHMQICDNDGGFPDTSAADPGAAQPNKRPLLDAMADPALPFYRGLARFSNRTLYANTINDRVVGFTTSSLETTNHYNKPGARWVVHPEYPSIVTREASGKVDVAATKPDDLDDPSMLPTSEEEKEMAAEAGEGVTGSTPTDVALGATTVAAVGAAAVTAPAFPNRWLLVALSPILIPTILVVLSTMLAITNVRNITSANSRGSVEEARKVIAEYITANNKPTVTANVTDAKVAERPTDPGELRKSIIARLNQLEWIKNHVRIPHRRSHAAIVSRPGFDVEYADVMQKLVTEFIP
ncbi:hypothetical protein HDU87_003793 [Geranomyces variabilis]|uniref:DUF676 domain-containing protein n=1 Tax=Geranomyces variabilis TaxID=109894 RepID=A0AAD5TJM5_9FUNG|nr:hypothetical protein HDU87_003793 [Geranomyces variabilis]